MGNTRGDDVYMLKRYEDYIDAYSKSTIKPLPLQIVICSGPKDVLSLRHSIDRFTPISFNSESTMPDREVIRRIQELDPNPVTLYDMDEVGRKYASQLFDMYGIRSVDMQPHVDQYLANCAFYTSAGHVIHMIRKIQEQYDLNIKYYFKNNAHEDILKGVVRKDEEKFFYQASAKVASELCLHVDKLFIFQNIKDISDITERVNFCKKDYVLNRFMATMNYCFAELTTQLYQTIVSKETMHKQYSKIIGISNAVINEIDASAEFFVKFFEKINDESNGRFRSSEKKIMYSIEQDILRAKGL